jgi:hypothetical protein
MVDQSNPQRLAEMLVDQVVGFTLLMEQNTEGVGSPRSRPTNRE